MVEVQEPHAANLPSGWVWATLKDISEIILGQSPPSSTYNKEGKGLPFYQGKLDFGQIYPSPTTWCVQPRKIVEKGDVLISVRAPVGPTNICPEKSSIGRGLAAVRGLGGIDSFFILYLLRSVQHKWKGTGTTFEAINGDMLKDLAIPIPPLAELLRIVSKLEELFTKLDAGVTALRKAKEQLKQYRISLFATAFSGMITEDWRRMNPHTAPVRGTLEQLSRERKRRYDQLLAAKNAASKKPQKDYNLFDIKQNKTLLTWADARLENLVYFAGRIGWRGLKADEYTQSGPLFLSVFNIQNGKNVDFGNSYHISQRRYEESPEIQLQENDILLVKDGAGIGKLGIVKNLKEPATVNSSLLVIRSREAFLPEYLFYFLQGPQMQAIVKSRITGSATPHLFQRDIAKFVLSIPPVAEQAEIIEKLKRHLSVIDNTDCIIAQNIISAKRLRQSILTIAFEGNLVPRNPNDEPASVLLSRIQQKLNKGK